MEYWGLEVKPGESLLVVPGDDKYLHLSQANLGETKKDKESENIQIFLKIDDQKRVFGHLSTEKYPQLEYDIVFEKEFELSHSSKNTTVNFFGYKTYMHEINEDYSESDSEDEEILLPQNTNGKLEVKNQAKPIAGKANSKGEDSSGKLKGKKEEKKVKIEELNKAPKPKAGDDDEDDDDDDEDDDSEDDDSASDDDMLVAGNESDDDDDLDEDESSDEEDEVTPKKLESGKRPAGSAAKTPVPEKKAKLTTPAGSKKTGGDSKKGAVHTATPYPSKQVGKTPANSGNAGKSKPQTPKSGGSVTCKSCSRAFNSDTALQSHTKAKHSTDK